MYNSVFFFLRRFALKCSVCTNAITVSNVSRRYVVLFPRSLKTQHDATHAHSDVETRSNYALVQHVADLYSFLVTPFCASRAASLQSVRLNLCHHGNRNMLHMSAIAGPTISALNVDKVRPLAYSFVRTPGHCLQRNNFFCDVRRPSNPRLRE